ncbi:hypothetical protein G9C98_003808 [Cotesia typhae]|uniref:DUF4758 domain-containing protein n=1 Tax=Cotesia typhae TaxID=2053667 RepID=A0A8J5R3B3_9HYME|nr:hypothetical protein G9C98_003808 [Cotesia typhae]
MRGDLTTVLLVSARPGKLGSPVGLIGKTARTFVQDGASTEYATQVVGTTLDDGRGYARILSTSSRVFYDKDNSNSDPSLSTPESSKVKPFVVYPSRVAPQDEWKLFGGIIEEEDSSLTAGKREEAIIRQEISSSSSSSSSSSNEPHDQENDIFEMRREFNVDNQRFKPAKIRTPNLPTYTVTHGLIGAHSGLNEDNGEETRSFKPRAPKIFKQPARPVVKKESLRSFSTVTYYGFADFTTIVGDTVIVFSPSTSPAPSPRPVTKITGDATLRPGDGSAVMIQPTSTMQNDKTADPLLDAINGHKQPESSVLTPSIVEEPEELSSSQSTPLLLLPETESLKPTGLLKVVDSTTSLDGTTTHYKSLIYGTYVGTNYAQIIHTSSNVYFFPDEATVSYDTTIKPEEDTEEPLTTTEMDITTINPNKDETLSISGDNNELTTPLEETTENSVNIVQTTPMEPEIPNDIVGDPQARSVKGGSDKNNIENSGKKLDFATRLLPSTAYKTFTYFTTFFIPDETNKDITTTSVKSREVISSEVSYLTELILPSTTTDLQSSTTSTGTPETLSVDVMVSSVTTATTPSVVSESTPKEEKDEDPTTKREEIELIFKTLYTTYTYLTTFFQESTSSVSSREVVETNVVTQTIGPDGISGDVVGLFNEETTISPTKIVSTIQSSTILVPEEEEEEQEEEDSVTNSVLTTLEGSTTEAGLTTLQDLENSKTTIEDSFDKLSILEPSPTPNVVTDLPKYETKTYFTTYTYFTTIFVDDETEIETRTEVFSNIITEKIEPTAVVPPPQETSINPTTPKSAPAPPPEILAYLEALKKQKSQEEALRAAKQIQEAGTDKTTMKPEENKLTTIETLEGTTEKVLVDGEVLGSMITDVISSSSSTDGPILEPSMEKRNAGNAPDDQELSESNNHEVEPPPTLLLRTSYTTFTYFTTMYKGEASNIVSRLETVTNVVTETIRPTPAVELPITETSTLPVTYFTTFTYWTTFYRAGDTITTSREETVSNVVTPGVSPTPSVKLGVIMTYRPDSFSNDDDDEETTDKAIADNEVMEQEKSTSPIPSPKEIIYTTPEDLPVIDVSTINPEPTTYYTTFTYFTTSYIGNETILNSRLETITSVARGDILKPTGRAIGTVPSQLQDLETKEKVRTVEVTPTKIVEEPKTGLVSTIKSSEVGNGTTTHYSTDIYGTYINGLYAQVVQSTTSLETQPSASSTLVSSTASSATPALPTGILSLNKGSIIDADKVTTVYFATSQIGTLIDGLYAKVIESTSSTKIDAERKATLKHPEERHRTGLVRLIKGQIESDSVTIVYQSKVIGTSIEGRYAQIIESTSSYLQGSSTVSPTATTSFLASQAPGFPSPTPVVIQSSLSEGNQDDNSTNEDENEGGEEEDEEENEDDQKPKKKSRLTYPGRKSTFTPAIRPFLSRSRPTFNPKRKGAQAATTITRTDITPTITASLAATKGNRFTSSRNRPAISASSTTSYNASKRFSGRKASGNLSLTTPSSARSKNSGRFSPSSSSSFSRRGPSSVRGSSARPAVRVSSSAFAGSSSRFRTGIRPSSTLLKPSQTLSPTIPPVTKSDDQEDEANEFTTTTFVTEETPFPTEFEDFEDTATTIPVRTTTESSRRSTNPLLKYRRPLAPVSRGTPPPRRTTSSSTTTTPKTPTGGLRSSNARSLNSPTLPPFSPRSRGSNRLFPPRNFINQRQLDPVEGLKNPEDNDDTNLENEKLVEEIVDNDYEGSENNKRRRIPNKNDVSTTTSRPTYGNRFTSQRRRSKRQAPQRGYANRYRRPGNLYSSAEDRSDDETFDDDDETTKPTTRYTIRGRALSSRNSAKSSTEKYSSDSGEISNTRNRRPTNTRVKPTPTSLTGRQFTLREKNSSYNKRPTVKQDNLRRPNSRVRTSGRYTTESYDSRRGSTSWTSPRTRNINRKLPTRGRSSSREDLTRDDIPITVTHYVPTEVTLPVVNHGTTEYRSIITASPSIEVVNPDAYNTVTGGDGRQLLVLNSELTSLNPLGQTEVTRFLLHGTPTSRVSYTLTTTRGRRVSQSTIVPSTVYSVENVVSTIPASFNNQNNPLANILLSQLLLGQFGPKAPNFGNIQAPNIQATVMTQYNVRTTSYVTTITKEQSTIVPLTFRGKQILTTLVDSITDVVTATEFITGTIVVTPTAVPNDNLNSLLFLLQQSPQIQQQQQQIQQQIQQQDPLFSVAPITSQSNSLPGELERKHQPADLDYRPEDDSSASVEEFDKPVAPKKPESKNGIAEKRVEISSSVLSISRRKRDLVDEVKASIPPLLYQAHSEATSDLSPSEEFIGAHTPTQSLESVVGDVGRHISTSIRA